MNAELGLAATELVRVSEGSSEVIERNSIDGLVQHAQNIASQLQGLVNHQSADEDALIACNDEIPYSELLRRLSTTLERQRTINEVYNIYNRVYFEKLSWALFRLQVEWRPLIMS